MPHILLNRSEINGNPHFQTHSAILKKTPYPPKVLIVGTYNEGNLDGNLADFFYGRNYFWPVFWNLSNNSNQKIERRILKRREMPIPSLKEVLNLCIQFKLTFADLITNVNTILPNHNDTFLDKAVYQKQTTNNNKAIANFINRTKSITHVYATTKFCNNRNLYSLWHTLKDNVRAGVSFGNVLTPSGQGGIPNFNQLKRTGTIARYWLWVNHHQNPYGEFKNQKGYTHFDHMWLKESGVNTSRF